LFANENPVVEADEHEPPPASGSDSERVVSAGRRCTRDLRALTLSLSAFSSGVSFVIAAVACSRPWDCSSAVAGAAASSPTPPRAESVSPFSGPILLPS
jgi:hypothetical protein